jgi:TonB family protein
VIIASARAHDPFRQMLAWSSVMHGLLFAAIVLASYSQPSARLLPEPVGEFINVSLGQSGPIPGIGGLPLPAPVTLEPEPEPPKKEPTVVRPTKEQRNELPSPEAQVKKPPRFEKPKQDSGLRGKDAASAQSAALKTASGVPGLGLAGASGGSPFDGDFQYDYYASQMFTKIHQHWQRTVVRGKNIHTIVQFTIQRDGEVTAVEVERSCGARLLDRSAMRAVILANPLPPLPNSFLRDQQRVHLQFFHSE